MSLKDQNYSSLSKEVQSYNATLVAVSKIQPAKTIMHLYNLGQRDFGENYVQELVAKQAELPDDISWHFIGHLQTNKVKYIIPFIHLIQSVDSLKLLREINKQGKKYNRIINVLLQVFIAQEETKYGMDEVELALTIKEAVVMKFIRIEGFMGMASFSDNQLQIKKEFKYLKTIYNKYPQLTTLSMGMSSDYKIALTEGSNMVRIGSLIFGERS